MRFIKGAAVNPMLYIGMFFFLACLACAGVSVYFSHSNYNLMGAFSTAAVACLGLGFYLSLKADKKYL